MTPRLGKKLREAGLTDIVVTPEDMIGQYVAEDIINEATGEKRGFSRAEFEALFGLAEKGIGELFAMQRAAVAP